MIRRIWIAYTVEFPKALQRSQTFLGPALVMAAVMGAAFVCGVSTDGVSDYGYIAYVTPLALNFLGFILLLIFCAGLLSQEMQSGSIRQVLVRPLYRHEYVLAKMLLGMTYAATLTILVALGSWCIASALGELTGVTYGGELIYTKEEMRTAYVLGALLGLAPQAAAVAYAVMFSALTRSTVGAVSGAVGLWLLIDLVKHPLQIERFVFFSYIESPWQVFAGRCDAIDVSWFPMVWYCLGTSAASAVVCAGVAMLVMHLRSLS